MIATPVDTDQIVITASRTPEQEARTAASVTIVDQDRIERLGSPLLPDILRLTPSASVTTSGPAGSFTEVRIRGAEVNHTLLFVDGIRVNDPATGDFPRFELLNADLASRIEVVRGPQSALWGSEAIGGVVAINGLDDEAGSFVFAEGGTFGLVRAAVSTALVSDQASFSAAIGSQRASGIDSFSGDGDRDGYRNLSGRARGSWRPTGSVELQAAGIALTGRTEFDGFDPLTYARADTLDASRNRLLAGRLAARFGGDASPWQGQVSGTLLGSSNGNYVGNEQINRTRGMRHTLGGQVEHLFATGGLAHQLIAAIEAERETFHARDTVYGGQSDQDRSREHRSLTFQWRSETGRFIGDLAVRRDSFNRFEDVTSVRASLLARIGRGFSLAGSYGEGIAQPTFFDLYGFFPDLFLGNPSLKAESSRGLEVSLGFRRRSLSGTMTIYRQTLKDEIVDVFDFASSRFSAGNRSESSNRSGVEAEFGWMIDERLRLGANYAYLHATQPAAAGDTQVRELRRPKHSGSLTADGAIGRFGYGASLAYVGRRWDQRDAFPFERVSLGSYWLATVRVAFEVSPTVELFARGSNLLDRRYQDVFGYRTEGRGVAVGLRLADRRSSP